MMSATRGGWFTAPVYARGAHLSKLKTDWKGSQGLGPIEATAQSFRATTGIALQVFSNEIGLFKKSPPTKCSWRSLITRQRISIYERDKLIDFKPSNRKMSHVHKNRLNKALQLFELSRAKSKPPHSKIFAAPLSLQRKRSVGSDTGTGAPVVCVRRFA